MRGLVLLFLALSVVRCTKNSDNAAELPAGVEVSWSASKESVVNSAGGGYRIVYSATKNAPIDDSISALVVPFENGNSSTRATLQLLPGSYYVRVIAFGKIAANLEVSSSVSDEIEVTVP